MIVRVLMPLALLTASEASSATLKDQDGKETTPTNVPAAEKKICRSEVPIGSIMPKRTCKTKAEWDAIKAQQQQNAERFGQDRDNGSLRPPGS